MRSSAGCVLAHLLGASILIDHIYAHSVILVAIICYGTATAIFEYCLGIETFLLRGPATVIAWVLAIPMKPLAAAVNKFSRPGNFDKEIADYRRKKASIGNTEADERWQQAARTKLFWILLAFIFLSMAAGLVMQAATGEERWGYYGILVALPAMLWWTVYATTRR